MAIDPKNLRKAQLIMLDMLVELDEVCQKHNLNYWLDSGTLLGAVRHEGFIPWDDDIDISMPMEDYQKLKEIAQDVFSDAIFFQTRKTDPAFKFDYIKLRSNRASIVEFHEKDREVEYHQGVFVDIFPMLTLPNTEFHHTFYEDTFKLIRDVSSVSLHTPNGEDYPETRARLVEALSVMHEGFGDESLKVIYGGEMPDLASWFDHKRVFPLKKMKFEGLEFYAPNDSHHYLENIYSFNFMELPPKDKRTIHAWSISLIT